MKNPSNFHYAPSAPETPTPIGDVPTASCEQQSDATLSGADASSERVLAEAARSNRSQLETDDEVRRYCRNPRCRSKLPAPVSNPREAFCTRGCHNSFYRHRCLICERPIEQPKRGRRLICRKPKCRRALRSNSCLGSHHTSFAAKAISNKADFIGVKQPLKPRRPWRIRRGCRG